MTCVLFTNCVFLCFSILFATAGKRGIEQEESSGSPLRKKTSSKASAISSTSLGARLRKFRSLTSEHCRTANFEAWSRELWQLGSWWMEIAAEEAAGVVYDLVEEFKREQAREKGLLVIPTVSGNAFLDKLQAKSLVTCHIYYTFT